MPKKKYLVTMVIQFSKVIEANNKRQALEYFSEHNAETRQLKFTAKEVIRR